MEPLAFAGLALALGVKHAFDADHMVAVGPLLAHAPSRRSALTMSASWAAGHMLTAGLLTITLFLSGQELLASFREHLEVALAAMLVAVGLACVVLELRVVHAHAHAHGGVVHEHAHMHLLGRHRHGAMAGIGIVHGIASNDELLLLLAASLGATSLGGVLAGVGIFSAGVLAGMALFALALTAPLLRAHAAGLRRGVSLAMALASLGYGLALLAPRLGVPGMAS